MNTPIKHTLTIKCLALLIASTNLANADNRTDSVTMPDPQKLFTWTTEEKVIGFSHSSDIFSTESFNKGSKIYPLPDADSDIKALANSLTYQYGSDSDGSPHKENTVDDFMKHNKAAALLVIKDGKVALEKYRMGLDSSSVWDGKSVSKSVTSTLLGAAIKEGAVKSLDDTVETYIPELKGSVYDGMTLLNLLRMSTGVKWNETEVDPQADLSKMLRCLKETAPAACIVNLMKSLQQDTDPATGQPIKPGAVFVYNTGEAYLTGLVVQRATQMNLAQYLQKKIWQPYGMEADGNWWVQDGVATGGSGFNATLRDYGRFGQFILNNGTLPDGTQILPDNWIRDATTWSAASVVPHYADNGMYGYMWWFNPAYDDALVDGKNLPDPIYAEIGAPLQNTTVLSGAVPVQGRGPIDGQPGSVSDWTFAAVGIYGQFIAINQRENLVVVQWSTWDQPDPKCCDASDPQYVAENPYNEQAVFLNALIRALH